MTYNEARDEILNIFNTALADTGTVICWDDLPFSPPSAAWIRISIKHHTGHQSSLADPDGVKVFERNGTIYCQVFTPMGDGLTANYDLCQLISNAFESAKGCVWYRNVRVNEVGQSGAFGQNNVLCDFTFRDAR